MANREWVLKIVGDTKGAEKALGTLGDDAEKTSGRVSGAFKTIGAAVSVAAVATFGKAIVTSASDQEQAIGALNSVFKDYADEMNAFGQTTAENLGISRAEFSQMAAVTGSMLKNAGVPMDEVAESTKGLTERAADLAAMYGGTVPEAMDAINSALKGEMDPLEKYAVSLKASSIEAKAVAMGLVDAEGKATDYGKAMATQALIMEQSADAAGTFAKEGDTVAGQTARMSAQFKDLQADLGKKLLPVITKATKFLTEFVEFVSKNQKWLVPLAAGITGVVVAIKAWQMAQTAWGAAMKVATAVQWAFNAAMTANPIGLIVAAIAAVVAAVVLLYTKVDWFRAAVDTAVDAIVIAWEFVLGAVKKVFEWVKDNWPLLLAIITGPFGLAVLAITKNWDTIKQGAQTVVDTVKRILSAIVNIIKWPFEQGINAARDIIGRVKGFFDTAVSGIRTALSILWSVITTPFTKAWETVRDLWNRATELFRGIKDGIESAFWNLAEIIKAPFEAAFRAIKSLWNNTVGGFGFSTPSWIPKIGGKRFEIPRMAAGGIVTRPTVALIGEAGPEAVIPLNGRYATGGGVTINVYALTAGPEVGRAVWQSLREYERVNGKLPA